MQVTISQKELLQILNEKFDSEEVEITNVAIQVELGKYRKENIYISGDDWFLGTFIIEKIKKGEDK